jgi:uncharacterized BrkB/YihY/UPF0761 family membrane protein
MISMLLLMLAVVCFAISTWTPATQPHWHRLVAAGLAAWALAQLLSQVIK